MNDSADPDAKASEPRDAPAQEQGSGKPLSSEVPALGLVRPLAAMAVIAMILGRIIGPASTGLVVGAGRVTRGLELAGSITTQLFAMAATVVTMAEIIAVTKSKLPSYLRLAAISVGGFGVIVGLSAAIVRVPGASAVVLGTGAALLAIAAAKDAARAPFARVFAVTVGLLAAAGLARLASAGLADFAAERASLRLADVARGVATASLVIDALALLVAMSILSSSARKLASPITMIALLIAFIATRQALLADADDAGVASLLLRRAADRLMTRPEPFIPVALRIFVSFLAITAAFLALLVRGHVPALTGALSLALLARGAPDMPLGALVLIIAALSMALAARDERGVSAAIVAAPRRSEAEGGASGEGVT